MIDNSSILKRMCNKKVYMDNVFHILGVGINVTPRKLRRRHEDLDTAHELGGASWDCEFKHLLGNCEVPTYQEVDEAFSRIENPEERIVSEFFWFWPVDDNDSSLDALLLGRKAQAIKVWESGEYAYGKTRLISIHNLAILYHLYAIDAELQALSAGGSIPADFHAKMCGYWDKSFAYWEQLADNDDFWDLFSHRVNEFNDPRLTGSFVRRFRAEFPVAFDNINAYLAADYAKLEAYTDAKRHVEYMLKTMSGLDDVQSTLNVLFEPMEGKVKRLVDNFDAKIKQSPKQGLEFAKALLDDTDEIRRIAVGLLSEGHKIRTGLLSEIAGACNRYQVAYGNETKDWKSCLEALMQLRSFACTPELKKTVESNIAIVKDNLEFKTLREMCWICKTNKACVNYGIDMYGEVCHDWFSRRITWRHLKVNIPICSACNKKKVDSDNVKTLVFCVVALISFAIGCCVHPEALFFWILVAAA